MHKIRTNLPTWNKNLNFYTNNLFSYFFETILSNISYKTEVDWPDFVNRNGKWVFSYSKSTKLNLFKKLLYMSPFHIYPMRNFIMFCKVIIPTPWSCYDGKYDRLEICTSDNYK